MFTLPKLAYGYDALSPSISEEVMQLHHAKHHQTYVDKLNAAIVECAELSKDEYAIVDLLRTLDEVPSTYRSAVRNNGGGHYNHSLFWSVMTPGGNSLNGQLLQDINSKYGSLEALQDEFNKQALGLFGSGWVWLMPDLSIITTPNQDNPIMSGEPEPILGLDVWEHAYYLDYKNVRPEYVTAWWKVVDWTEVAHRYQTHLDQQQGSADIQQGTLAFRLHRLYLIVAYYLSGNWLAPT